MPEPRYRLKLILPGGQVKHYALSKPVVTIGRSATNDIAIPDSQASRRHARLVIGPDALRVSDLKSVNGTFLNGKRVEQADVKLADQIKVGESVIQIVDAFSDQAEDESGDGESGGHFSMILADKGAPRLGIYNDGEAWEVALGDDPLVIGRSKEADLRIAEGAVSRKHARIERVEDEFFVEDLDSRRGTWIAGERIEREALRDGDVMHVGDALLVFKRGFDSEDLTSTDNTLPPVSAKGRPPVVIIPGLMGCELWEGDERVWPSVRRLLNEPEIFRLEADGPTRFEARDIVREVTVVPGLLEFEQYDRLSDLLIEDLGYTRGKDLLEFAFDWRLDNRLSARKLAQAIDEWDVEGPIVLIGHSMGCLIARYYIDVLGGGSKVGRMILIGSPTQGAPIATYGLAAGLDLIPLTRIDERVGAVLRSFPSLYQMIPTFHYAVDRDTGKTIDLFADERWIDEAHRPYLRNAHNFLKELKPEPGVPTVSIFGYGVRTVTRASIKRDKEGRWKDVDLLRDEAGDDTVPQGTAILRGSLIHPVWQHHGALYVDSEVQARLIQELVR